MATLKKIEKRKKMTDIRIQLLLLSVFLLVFSCNNEPILEENLVDDTTFAESVDNDGLRDRIFNFDPKRWGIVEGIVSDDVALRNRDILNSIMQQARLFGINVFQIGAMDAYFKVDVNKIGRVENSGSSIQIPSDFHLKMSENTFLRVQPNSAATYTLMTTYLTDNVTISGGNLIGDRFEHDYSPFTDAAGVKRDEHGWGHLLWIIGSENILVENVSLSRATGDGIVFHSETLRNNDGTLRAGTREVNTVLVKDVNIDECRRNGISVLDGRNITFDNCIITNTGNGPSGEATSGTAPRYGIDLESIRTRNDDGTLNETALIENVVIKNSTFTNNEAGDIVVYTANNVVIDNNFFDKWVANKASYNVDIINNTFKSRNPKFFAIGIDSFIDPFGNELNHNYKISNNTISDYSVGIKVAGENQEVSNNNITDCVTGISLISNLKDSTFSDNKITSDLSVSFGYKNLRGCNNINNLNIVNEEISVRNRPVSFNVMFTDDNFSSTQVTFENCLFLTQNTNFSILVKEAKNIDFVNNRLNTGFLVLDSENINLINNQTNLPL